MSNQLTEALKSQGKFALLDYPDHLNVGDHLIWLGTLQLMLNNEIAPSYCASLADFNADEMERRLEGGPILFAGGGNLGDQWPDSQKFREKLIAKYTDRPIIILPQSVHFVDPESAMRASKIFNGHPDLTIFTRESRSFDLAKELFPQCRVIKAPDITLWPEAAIISLNENPHNPVIEQLYLCRKDAELVDSFCPSAVNLSAAAVEDWCTYSWVYTGRGKVREFNEWYWKIPGAADAYRQWWQRGFAHPSELISRWAWNHGYPLAAKLAKLPNANLHRFSWGIAFDAVKQVSKCKLLITNRLHGQILASLLGIPSILLPNAYHKNESYFSTWLESASGCRFVKTPDELRAALGEVTAG